MLTHRFVIDRIIGRGVMGVVYRATDRLLGRPVAVKVIRSAGDAMSLQRFLREVEAMADLAHPAVVRSFHVDVSGDGRLFQVQELVAGASLEAVRARPAAEPHASASPAERASRSSSRFPCHDVGA